MAREVISTPKGPAAVGPYSQAIKANGFVFVSGQLGLIPDTKQFAGNTVAAQTEQALKNISAILQAAGSSLPQVVKVMVLLADMSAFAEMNGVYATFFPNDPPARATFAVKGLPLDALVEIEVMALA
jgi:2-iminobutanoate/2-iminopropanoate deaminase